MKDKKVQSAQTLLWLSSILIILGVVVISPAAGFISQIAAALFAVIAIALGRGSTRIMAIVLTIASIALAYVTYPDYKKHMDDYIQRAQQAPSETTNY
jgi:membrane protein implicated in regulation of membrane protease activity